MLCRNYMLGRLPFFFSTRWSYKSYTRDTAPIIQGQSVQMIVLRTMGLSWLVLPLNWLQ